MRQRRDFQALRNKGFAAAVSMRALIAWLPLRDYSRRSRPLAARGDRRGKRHGLGE
jgi:hypothetical protein